MTATLRLLLPWSPQPGWRNWQTRRPQKPLLERVCGFESHSGHCYRCTMSTQDLTLSRRRRGALSRSRITYRGRRYRVAGIYPLGASSSVSATSPDVDVSWLLLEASDDDVVRTDRAQLATFALSLVGYHELLDLGVRPRYLLGHSLGEFSALVASGLLSLEEGARLIAVRGAAMARAAELEEGSMVAVMGGDDGRPRRPWRARRRVDRQHQRHGTDRRQRNARGTR